MPEGYNFEVPAAWAVIDEVSSSRQVQATCFRISGVFDQGADAGLFDQ
jgi:hypothetical protein